MVRFTVTTVTFGSVQDLYRFCKVLRFVNGARLRFSKITSFKRYGLTTVMYRGWFETVKTPKIIGEKPTVIILSVH